MVPSAPPIVVVTGDLIRDHHLYRGERRSLSASDIRGTRHHPELGGAELIRNLLQAILGSAARIEAGAELTAPDGPSLRLAEAHAIWAEKPGPDPKPADKVWRLQEPLGFGGEDPPAPPARDLPPPDILVLADGGHRFRQPTHRPLWHLPLVGAKPPRWILLKHAAPVATGALWDQLQPHLSECVVGLVAAEDLRDASLSLSRGLSWEASVIGLHRALHDHPQAVALARYRHLLVTFGADGALWLDNADPKAPKATLLFDAAGAEGAFAARFDGGSIGGHSAVAAAVAAMLVGHHASGGVGEPDLATAVDLGLQAARDLLAHGHGPVRGPLPAGFPKDRLAKLLTTGTPRLARAEVPWNGDLPETWSIAETLQAPGGDGTRPTMLRLAMQVARWGPSVLDQVPHGRFGALVTAERTEIEALRHVRALMRGYAAERRPRRPLSIGVFGPPGAGKSFGVKELSKEVFGEASWLEFNLSQFEGPHDLHGAFHRIRDLVLAGRTPVAFWDEFDSQDLRWLQYLLAPMQDGTFQAGQLIHAIGKCVFVFAGGTKSRFEAFAEPEDTEAFRLKKGPDFVSRLDAHYDVLGPNPVEPADPADLRHALRRALLIRGQLRLGDTQRLQVDDGLLNALLTVPSYRHGSRSLEKLLQSLHREEGVLRRSQLPSRPQLAMHVDPEAFVDLFRFEKPQGIALASADVVEIR